MTKEKEVEKEVDNSILQSLREAVICQLTLGLANLEFTKKDGSVRLMNGTLSADYIPAKQLPKPLTEAQVLANEEKPFTPIIHVFDVDAKGWRSLNVENLISIGGTTYE